METSILGEVKKEFSDTIELQLHENNIIIDCQVKTSNTFAKLLSDNEIAVFGDYDLFVLFRYISLEKENRYEVIMEKRNLVIMHYGK